MEPSGLGINTTGAAHQLIEGTIIFASIIFSISCLINSRSLNDFRYGGITTGVSVVVSILNG